MSEPIRRGMPAEVIKPAAKAPAQVTGIFEVRCNICRLSRSHPEIVELVHQRHFRDRWSYDAIIVEVNDKIAAEKLEVKPLVHSGFTAHFTKHVPGDVAFLHRVQSSYQNRGEAGRDEQPDDVLTQVLEYKRENIANLQAILVRWQKIADSAFGHIPASMGGDGDDAGEVSASPLALKAAMTNFDRATQAITGLTTVMDRYVNSKDFVVGILREGIKMLAALTAQQLGRDILQVHQDTIEQKVAADQIADYFYTHLAERLGESAKQLSDETSQIIIEKYKLRG